MGMFIPDPDPDPRIKKAPDPGSRSATLVETKRRDIGT
jgi:hypothetical protein